MRLEFTFALPIGVEPAFEFFSRASNLNRVTPPWFRFEILSPQPIRMTLGTRIDYRLRWRGLRLRWRSRVTDWEPPGYFVYEQERGPYRAFRHEHLFLPEAGGTRVVDRVQFRAPGGAAVKRWIVEPELRRIFAYRAAAARVLFADQSPSISTRSEPSTESRLRSGTSRQDSPEIRSDATTTAR